MLVWLLKVVLGLKCSSLMLINSPTGIPLPGESGEDVRGCTVQTSWASYVSFMPASGEEEL